ncbi:hypothetical protein [uncultured Anaerococcus sp.]|uniref:hypothetical protein n=1 Tax=uncultured Anaerococcus sp. TaxID=293428 RepID=UPI002889C21E|nr:hypothetical protein [uncultured Anaerococcus sp.]
MKVIICSCARCTAHGNEYLYDSAELVKKDVDIAYEVDNLGKAPEIEIVYKNIMEEVEDAKRLSPIVKIDEEYITKAKPEVLMEKMYAKMKVLRDQRRSELSK